jgi:YjbE family integral membrane protein
MKQAVVACVVTGEGTPAGQLGGAGLDLGILGKVSLDWSFLSSLFSIVLIDLILAGDNAVVIAMAVRSLPSHQRRKGIILGSAAAVILRVILTFFVAQMLQINYLKLVGGVLITWIAVKLFVEGSPDQAKEREAASLTQAVKIIVIADITMALDNMLAVGGASHGNVFLLLFGLGLSIPFIVFTSNLLSMLMDKYPVIIYAGAAVLGKVGGEMIITDPIVAGTLAPGKPLIYAVEAVFAVGVILVGKLWMKRLVRKEEQKIGVCEAVDSSCETDLGSRQ